MQHPLIADFLSNIFAKYYDKSDNAFTSYSWKHRGSFFWDTVCWLSLIWHVLLVLYITCCSCMIWLS